MQSWYIRSDKIMLLVLFCHYHLEHRNSLSKELHLFLKAHCQSMNLPFNPHLITNLHNYNTKHAMLPDMYVYFICFIQYLIQSCSSSYLNLIFNYYFFLALRKSAKFVLNRLQAIKTLTTSTCTCRDQPLYSTHFFLLVLSAKHHACS